MLRHNFRTTDTSSIETTAEYRSVKKVMDSFVKRLSLGRNLLVVRMLMVTLLMVLVSAAGVVRQPARAAVVSAFVQGDALAAEGVVLDFDEGTHKKGEFIPLARIVRPGGGSVNVSPGDLCLSRHLHGPIEILECATVKDGALETRVQGPFFDPFASDPNAECGHGKVMPYRADVSVEVSGQPTATVGSRLLTYTLTLTNNGPHTADQVLVSLFVRFDNVSPTFTSTIEGADLLNGPTSCLIVALPANAKRIVTYRVKITDDGLIKEGVLVAAFFALTSAGCQNPLFGNEVIDPQPKNNFADSTTTFVRFGVTSAEKDGKNLIVTGDFGSKSLSDAVVLVNGNEKNTKVDAGNPTTTLIAKKGAKKLEPGQFFTVQVRFADGSLTPERIFVAPPE